jgi:hypothetical protein
MKKIYWNLRRYPLKAYLQIIDLPFCAEIIWGANPNCNILGSVHSEIFITTKKWTGFEGSAEMDMTIAIKKQSISNGHISIDIYLESLRVMDFLDNVYEWNCGRAF